MSDEIQQLFVTSYKIIKAKEVQMYESNTEGYQKVSLGLMGPVQSGNGLPFWSCFRSCHLRPSTEPACGYLYSYSVHQQICVQSLGCSLCLGFSKEWAVSWALVFDNAALSVVSAWLPGCRFTTDGQLDIHDKACWCHPRATYASPCGYDFLEIAFSQCLIAITMVTQSVSVHKHTHARTHKCRY